jgi:hypothetical protein
MTTLREIEADLLALESLLLELGGDVTEDEADAAIDQWLAEIHDALTVKLDGYATLIKNAGYRAGVRREEAKRLGELASLDEALAARLKSRLLIFMKEHDRPEIQTPLHRLRVTTSGGLRAMTMVEGAEVPDEYMMKVPDTKKIRSALESGVPLPFARLEERGQHLRIK